MNASELTLRRLYNRWHIILNGICSVGTVDQDSKTSMYEFTPTAGLFLGAQDLIKIANLLQYLANSHQ